MWDPKKFSGAGHPPLRNFEFDPSHLAADEQFACFADLSAYVGDHRAISDLPPFSNWYQKLWMVEDMAVTQSVVGPFVVTKNQQIIRREDTDYLALRLVLSGGQRALYNDNPAIMAPGEIHILDQGAHYFGVNAPHMATIAARVPYAAVGYDPRRHPSHINLTKTNPIASQLLQGVLISLVGSLDSYSTQDASTIYSGFCGLLRGILFGENRDATARRSVERARHFQIKQYIESQLADGELSPELLCKQFRMSRASLYRLFKEDGGIKNHINTVKLNRAMHLLTETSPQRGAVRKVAEQLGFPDQGHFTRLFKNRFQFAPSEVVGIWHSPQV